MAISLKIDSLVFNKQVVKINKTIYTKIKNYENEIAITDDYKIVFNKTFSFLKGKKVNLMQTSILKNQNGQWITVAENYYQVVRGAEFLGYMGTLGPQHTFDFYDLGTILNV